MVRHMKTTLEVSTPLLLRAKRMASEEQTTLRALVEEGLTRVIEERARPKKALPPLVTFKGKGLSPEFDQASWGRILDTFYEGRGA